MTERQFGRAWGLAASLAYVAYVAVLIGAVAAAWLAAGFWALAHAGTGTVLAAPSASHARISASAGGPAATGDTLADIRRRGVLVVGVKKDVPLWGQLDARTGRLVGLEPDLAAHLADRLGVRLELVGLLSAERLPALEQRRVDLLLATVSDTPERRARMKMVLPHYYASGVNVMARRSAGFREWTDLRNRRVCGRRGTFYNRAITVSSGVDVVALYDNSLAISALREGRCDGLLHDDTSIVAMLRDPAWSREFEMPLETLFVTPWAIALRPADAGSLLETFLSRSVVEWHRSGRVADLERRWGIPVSAFSARMSQIWRQRNDGGYYCGEQLTASTPKECL